VTLPGVAFLDHTADVGIDVEAPSLRDLLHRAALGMLALLQGEEEGPDEAAAADAGEDNELASTTVPVQVDARDPVGLLAGWLREILLLHEVDGLDYQNALLDRVEPDHLAGRILARPGGRAAREIKGVTYHELQAARRPDGSWHARVIFDV
jgi:SHS2 domain-containing protein